MVVIRLARVGRTKYAVYRIVAAEKRRSATSKFLAILGTYNPHTKELKLDQERIQEFIKNGAQPSDRVLRLLKSEKVELPVWAKTHDRFKKSKKSEESKPAEATKPAAAEVAADATSKSDESKQSVDAPETAATEEAVAKKQKEATEKVAEEVTKPKKPE